ncbi:hypothetical protein ACKKBF_B40240 [Auxenochlorella protothecoides x Auxenochlorella symbiontica]
MPVDLSFKNSPEAACVHCVLGPRTPVDETLRHRKGSPRYEKWAMLLLHLSLQDYSGAAAHEWVLPRDGCRARRAQALLGVLVGQCGPECYDRSSSPCHAAYRQQTLIWRHWHLSHLYGAMASFAQDNASRFYVPQDRIGNGLISIPPTAQQLQRHEHGLCQFRPGTVVTTKGDGQAYCIVIYTGCKMEEGSWHPDYIPENHCTLLCLNRATVPTVYNAAEDPVQFVPQYQLEPVDEEQLKTSIPEWLEGRFDVGRYFQCWDGSTCRFVPNAATASINGLSSHPSI